MGMNKMEMNPSRLLPQSRPNVVNIWFAKRGNAAPNAERNKSLPAYTEAM